MRDSLDAVLAEMERDVQSRTPVAAATHTNNNTSRLSLDDSSLLLDADAIGSSQVATCRNSIATESLFAFTQVGEAAELEPVASQSLVRPSDACVDFALTRWRAMCSYSHNVACALVLHDDCRCS